MHPCTSKMEIWWSIVIGMLVSVLPWTLLSQAGYVLEVRAHYYQNSNHLESTGACCDYALFSCGYCDNQFVFCLRRGSSASNGNPNNCPLGRHSTQGYTEDDSFTFGSPTFHGVPNPMAFHGNVWPGTVELYIEVEDYDPYNSNDHIDDVYVTVSLMPNSTFTPRKGYHGIYGRSTIELSFRLQCSSDLYGSNCTTLCVARNDSEGHYSCGPNGERICLNGWSEPTRNCTVPTCSRGCHLSRGYCNSTGSGQCLCSDGGNDTDCYQCVLGDDCYPLPCSEWQFPCQNETSCEIDLHIRGYFCRCAPGYQGENCTELSVNRCYADPCQNKGVCENSIDEYSCNCLEGFQGRNCEIDMNMCRSNPCLNDGTCTNSPNTFECTCAPGFNGLYCESIDACATYPCFHGTCIDLQNDSFECICLEGFEGQTCEVHLNNIDGEAVVTLPSIGSVNSATVAGAVTAAIIVVLVGSLLGMVLALCLKTRGIIQCHKKAIPSSVDNISPNPAYESSTMCPKDDNGSEDVYEHISPDAHVHMAPAMTTECAIDDKLHGEDTANSETESKNGSSTTPTDSMLIMSGENVYAQIH